MRILCCLNRDLASNVALNLLLPTLASHDVLVGLTERVGQASAVPDEPRERSELRIAEQSLPNDVLFPLLDAAGRPDEGGRYLTFQEIEQRRAIRCVPLPSPSSGAGLDRVREFAPDLILTIRYGAILKSPVIAIPRHGVLNLHSGLLPSYRGVLATFRALMHGDTEIGCTLHYIGDASIDTGDVVGEDMVAVDRNRSLLWHILRLYPPGIALMAAAVDRLARGEQLSGIPQVAGEGSYFSYPSADDWAEFRRRGWRVADPSDLADVFARYQQ
jgi:methionyl-tRNA formyltransferase